MQDVMDLVRWSATARMFGAQFAPIIDKVRAEIEDRVAAIGNGSGGREAVSFQAHAIASFAGNFGCTRLDAASRELQRSARMPDVEDLGPTIADVRAAAQSTIDFLRWARAEIVALAA